MPLISNDILACAFSKTTLQAGLELFRRKLSFESIKIGLCIPVPQLRFLLFRCTLWGFEACYIEHYGVYTFDTTYTKMSHTIYKYACMPGLLYRSCIVLNSNIQRYSRHIRIHAIQCPSITSYSAYDTFATTATTLSRSTCKFCNQARCDHFHCSMALSAVICAEGIFIMHVYVQLYRTPWLPTVTKPRKSRCQGR